MPGRGRGKAKANEANLTPEEVAEATRIFNSKPDTSDGSQPSRNTSEPAASTEKDQFEDAGESSSTPSLETTPTSAKLIEDMKKVHIVEATSKTENNACTSSGYATKSAEYKVVVENGTSLPGRSQSDSVTFKSKLNPKSSEFVPRSVQQSSLNVQAPAFVPRCQPDGPDPPLHDVGDTSDALTVTDILLGFDRVTKGDIPILTSTATMLLEATMFPATFDSHLSILTHLIRGNMPSDEVVYDLAEMLLQWGINNSGLRYTAIKIADYYCQLETKEEFRPKLFNKLQKIYKDQLECKHESNDEISFLIELSLFMAEMFYRVRIANNEVIWVLAEALFELMFLLVDIKTDEAIIQTCSILKLCGDLLENRIRAIPPDANFKPNKKMDLLLSILRQLAVDRSLSERTVRVLLATLQYRGSGYGRYDDMSQPEYEQENPVKNVKEWEEYVDSSGNIIEGEDDLHLAIDIEDQQDPNIDDDLLKEYEEFVQEFEEHLLMQEFGQQY